MNLTYKVKVLPNFELSMLLMLNGLIGAVNFWRQPKKIFSLKEKSNCEYIFILKLKDKFLEWSGAKSSCTSGMRTVVLMNLI